MMNIGVILAILVLSINLHGQVYVGGIPAYPYPTSYKQPDGSELVIMMKGDERVNWATTEDGYSLVKNQGNKAWEYAIVNSHGDMVSSGIIAHTIAERTISESQFLSTIEKGYHYSKAQLNELYQQFPLTLNRKAVHGFPTTGTVKMLVILVNFSNTTPTYTLSNFDNLMNQAGYSFQHATGSFKDYYLATSYKLTFNSTVVNWLYS